MRKATVEIDKVTGTRFPPERVTKDGREYSLKSIYADAGLDLDVQLDQADLPLPTAGENFDLPLLHEYMTRHRKAQRDGWYAHILVVPNIEYQEGWSIFRPLGVMYDFRSADANNMPREGCAMSMARVQDSDLTYLRTLAHELGHVFNLLHPKSEIPPLPIDTTIMNQTADLQELGAFPGNIQFTFSDRNRRWLSQGPAEFVMPGGRPFASRPDDASALVRDEAIETTPGLTFEISVRPGPFDLGEPLYLRVALRSDSNAELDVNSILSVTAGTVDVWITTPANRKFRFRPALTTCHEARPVKLMPGAEILASEAIFFGASGHSFPAPGEYQIHARYQSVGAGKPLAAVARTLTIEVQSSQSILDIDVADALASPSAALYLILRGGAHLRGAEDTLARIVREVPNRPAAQHAKIAMAAQALNPVSFDATKAASLLETVHIDALDITHRAEHQRLVGLAMACLGDDRAKDVALDKFAGLVSRAYPEASRLVQQTRGWIDSKIRIPK